MSISTITSTTQASATAYPKKTNAYQSAAATQAQPSKGDDAVTISQAAKNQLATSQTSSTSANASSKYDFTNMSPKQMLGAVNDLIKSGKMSLDESSSLVGMMGNLPLNKATNATSTTDISNQPVDFVSKLKQLIAFDQSINNTTGIEYANKALSALERLQGTTAPISQVARDRVAEESNNEQWLTALANRHTGVPELIKVDSALAGGRADIQSRLQQLLADHAIDPNASFTLAYDAASQSFRVDGVPEVKSALEAELNSTQPSAAGAAIREGYSLLSDMVSGLAAVREQYAQDRSGNEIASRLQGYTDRFSLGMQAGIISTWLES